jgi:large subunit ribosomal protein L25
MSAADDSAGDPPPTRYATIRLGVLTNPLTSAKIVLVRPAPWIAGSGLNALRTYQPDSPRIRCPKEAKANRMEKFSLDVQPRQATGHKVRHLRAEGWVPAVIYGGGQPSQPVQADRAAVDRLLFRGGASHLIELEGPSMKGTRVLIREIQRHPVRRSVLHLDFVRVAKGSRIRLEVPVILVGAAPVTSGGAILLLNANTVEIECLADDLPESIEVDVSVLETVHDRITYADLNLPRGVQLVSEHGEESVVSVTIPRAVAHEVEEEEVAEVPEGAEPELIERRREDEEEEED